MDFTTSSRALCQMLFARSLLFNSFEIIASSVFLECHIYPLLLLLLDSLIVLLSLGAYRINSANSYLNLF